MKKSLNTSPSGNARVINLRYIPLTSDKYQRDQPWGTGDAPSLYPPPPPFVIHAQFGFIQIHNNVCISFFLETDFIHLLIVNKDIYIQFCACDTFMK